MTCSDVAGVSCVLAVVLADHLEMDTSMRQYRYPMCHVRRLLVSFDPDADFSGVACYIEILFD